jgi:hypothetical protein
MKSLEMQSRRTFGEPQVMNSLTSARDAPGSKVTVDGAERMYNPLLQSKMQTEQAPKIRRLTSAVYTVAGAQINSG